MRVLGDTDGLAGGDDTLIVDHLPSMTVLRDRLDDGTPALVRDTVNLDGRGGTDNYFIYSWGSLADGTHDYIVNVLDSGAKDDGLDTLNIDGSADADVFLLRRAEALTEGFSAPVDANTPAFVALLHGTLVQVRDPDPNARRQDVERINYDENINSRLIVRGLGGDDYFAVDDNAAITTLDGGEGNDTFQIGQIYGEPRISTPPEDATVAAGDAFDTIHTTRGYISRGATFSLTAYGGTGEDHFAVYSNKAELRLEGNDGNDEFIVQAFALADESGKVSTEQRTDLLGGLGDDLIQYNVNAPVGIDGGAGFDRLVVIGTEFSDNFVITKDGVYGAGLNVKYDNIESLEVDGAEGDDHFFIQSTRDGVVTTVDGGNGNDTFEVSGDVTGAIVSKSLEGYSGVINHQVTSADLNYDDLLAPGISTTVADPTSIGNIVIDQSNGTTLVDEEGETVDSYTIHLAGTPAAAVYVNVSAARTTQEEEDLSGDSMLVSSDNVHWSRYLTLTFNDTTAQTVYVKAVDDPLAEGERVYAISHSSQSADENYNHVPVKNVLVTVYDNDQQDVIVKGTGHDNLVLEGDATTGITDTFTVKLGAAPTATVTVTLGSTDTRLEFDASSVGSRWDGSAQTLTFDNSNWNSEVTVEVSAAAGNGVQNRGISRITATADGGYDGTAIGFDVVDGDHAGLLVDESDGYTQVTRDDPDTPADESTTDTYTLRLTMAPTQNVTVTMLPDGQLVTHLTTTTPGSVTFTTADWWMAQTVTVAPNPAFTPDLEAQPLKFFPQGPHTLNTMAGPLYINGNFGTADRTLALAVTLPEEIDTELPGAPTQIDETIAIDRLNIRNDGSAANDIGQMDSTMDYDPISHMDVPTTNVWGLGLAGDLTLDTGTAAEPNLVTFRHGITFKDVEVAKVLLGQGDDTFTVNDTMAPPDGAAGALTIIEGGGNTAETEGDHIIVNGGGGETSPLVIYGDTSQDGLDYAGQSGVPSIHGIQFDYAGNDVIDAHNDTKGVTIYGGAGDDTIWGSQAGDHIAGGSGDDTIHGQGGVDHIYGDNGINIDEAYVDPRLVPANGEISPELQAQLDAIRANYRVLSIPYVDVPVADLDPLVSTDKLNPVYVLAPNRDDLMAPGDDTIYGDDGNDIVFGDFGVIDQTPGTLRILTTGNVIRVSTEDSRPGVGGEDTIYGNDGEDVLIGGAYGDAVDGGAGKDLIFGDNVKLDRTIGDGALNPRFRVLAGTVIYDSAAADTAQVTDAHQLDPSGTPVWEDFDVTLLFHDATTELAGSSVFGDDYIAGGAANDQIFGQLGNDTIQGDGSIDLVVGAFRDGNNELMLAASVDDFDYIDTSGATPVVISVAGNDGDDYIEGNGGNDVIFGNLGQDDIIGGSSNLFSLTMPEQRPDGADLIFGGSGTAAGRNDAGDTSTDGHARDSDVIVGDNTNIYRLVGVDGAVGVGTTGIAASAGFLSFNYDNYNTDGLKIIARAVEQLDYTPGGPSFDTMNHAASDIGAADEVHGEAGDDFIYVGMGSDVVFGDGQDDDIVGGYGNDWISGGTGDDGVIGDDGRIFTSRNGLTEPLNGVNVATVQSLINTPGDFQQADIYVTGTLTKAIDLTPFSQDSNWMALTDEFDGQSNNDLGRYPLRRARQRLAAWRDGRRRHLRRRGAVRRIPAGRRHRGGAQRLRPPVQSGQCAWVQYRNRHVRLLRRIPSDAADPVERRRNLIRNR